MSADHVVRSCPPWRTEHFTECGRPIGDVASVINRAQLKRRVRDYGKHQTSSTVCATCWSKAALFGRADISWDTDPSGVLLREYRWYRRRRDKAKADTEVRAIAALIAAHAGEFAKLITDRKGDDQ